MRIKVRHIRAGAFRAAISAALALSLCCAFISGCIPQKPEPALPTEPAALITAEPSPVPPTETPVPWREGDYIYELFSDRGSVHSLGLEVPVIDYSYSVPAFVPSLTDAEAMNREILSVFDNYIRAGEEGACIITSYKIGIRHAFSSLSPEFISGLESAHVTTSFSWDSELADGLIRLCVRAERIGPEGPATIVSRSFCVNAASGRRMSFDEILEAAELTHSDFYTLVCEAVAEACTEAWANTGGAAAVTLEQAQIRTLSANTVSGIAQQGLYVTPDGHLRFLAFIGNGSGGFDQRFISIDPADKPIPTPEPTEEPTEAPTAEPTEEPTAAPTITPTISPTAEPGPEPTAIPAAVSIEFFDIVPGLSSETPRELGLLASMIPGMGIVYSFERSAVRYEKSGLEFGCDLNAAESPALFVNITGSTELTLFGVGLGMDRPLCEARLWGFASVEGPEGTVSYDLGERGAMKLIYSGGVLSAITYQRYNGQ